MLFRSLIITLLISGCLWSCASVKPTARENKNQQVVLLPNDQDSTEYELTIFDSGFQSWFDKNHKPVWYYSKDYLATWNTQYVSYWNAKVRQPFSIQNQKDNPFIMEIDYRTNVDYGLELNYKLYHYFKYIEDTWGRILPYYRRN